MWWRSKQSSRERMQRDYLRRVEEAKVGKRYGWWVVLVLAVIGALVPMHVYGPYASWEFTGWISEKQVYLTQSSGSASGHAASEAAFASMLQSNTSPLKSLQVSVKVVQERLMLRRSRHATEWPTSTDRRNARAAEGMQVTISGRFLMDGTVYEWPRGSYPRVQDIVPNFRDPDFEELPEGVVRQVCSAAADAMATLIPSARAVQMVREGGGRSAPAWLSRVETAGWGAGFGVVLMLFQGAVIRLTKSRTSNRAQ